MKRRPPPPRGAAGGFSPRRNPWVRAAFPRVQPSGGGAPGDGVLEPERHGGHAVDRPAVHARREKAHGPGDERGGGGGRGVGRAGHGRRVASIAPSSIGGGTLLRAGPIRGPWFRKILYSRSCANCLSCYVTCRLARSALPSRKRYEIFPSRGGGRGRPPVRGRPPRSSPPSSTAPRPRAAGPRSRWSARCRRHERRLHPGDRRVHRNAAAIPPTTGPCTARRWMPSRPPPARLPRGAARSHRGPSGRPLPEPLHLPDGTAYERSIAARRAGAAPPLDRAADRRSAAAHAAHPADHGHPRRLRPRRPQQLLLTPAPGRRRGQGGRPMQAPLITNRSRQ